MPVHRVNLGFEWVVEGRFHSGHFDYQLILNGRHHLGFYPESEVLTVANVSNQFEDTSPPHPSNLQI